MMDFTDSLNFQVWKRCDRHVSCCGFINLPPLLGFVDWILGLFRF